MRCPKCASAIVDPAARVCPGCGVWLRPEDVDPEAILRPTPPPLVTGTRPAIEPAPGFDPAAPEFSTVTELDLEPEVVPFEPSVSTIEPESSAGVDPPKTLPPLAIRGNTPWSNAKTLPPSELPTDAAVRVPEALTSAPKPRAHKEGGETVESPLRAFIEGRTAEVTAPLIRYYEQSKRHEANGDIDGAIACLESALEHADDAALYNRLGILYARAKHDHVRACQMFERAVELAPGDPVYAKNLGKAERQRAKGQASWEPFKRKG